MVNMDRSGQVKLSPIINMETEVTSRNTADMFLQSNLDWRKVFNTNPTVTVNCKIYCISSSAQVGWRFYPGLMA